MIVVPEVLFLIIFFLNKTFKKNLKFKKKKKKKKKIDAAFHVKIF